MTIVGGYGNMVDGGWRMASDVPLYDGAAASQIERVQVRGEKPGALRFARSVGVEIERTRADFDLLPLPARP